jgi:hypothetical protein
VNSIDWYSGIGKEGLHRDPFLVELREDLRELLAQVGPIWFMSAGRCRGAFVARRHGDVSGDRNLLYLTAPGGGLQHPGAGWLRGGPCPDLRAQSHPVAANKGTTDYTDYTDRRKGSMPVNTCRAGFSPRLFLSVLSV